MNAPEGMQGITHALLRIMTGLMFWQHGAQKLLGMFGGVGPDGGSVSAFSWPIGIAGILEFLGGILIILGVKTRYVAFILAGQMAVAFWWRHFPSGFWPIANGGERAVLFCFIFLFLWANGGGKWGVDDALAKGQAGA
ncbi:MAG: DoxX family protein [Gemmatimonadetes bacterium]|nr:DoxX family protein [Gemmatimonadota bacterium]